MVNAGPILCTTMLVDSLDPQTSCGFDCTTALEPYPKPPIPFTGPIPGGLHERMMVTISGTVLLSCNRFNIDFQCGSCQNPQSDIALHFNPRFEDGDFVACNSLESQSWGGEETKKEMPFSKGRPFEIWVLVQHDSFLVIVNGRHFVEYRHRIPLSRVDTIAVAGGVEVTTINFQRFAPVPYNTAIPGGLCPSKCLIIKGIVLPDDKSFCVDLRRGRDVAFHLIPRFHENTIARNSFLEHSWGQEECGLPREMPLCRGQSFTINILCKAHCFAVAVNGQHQFEYNHRVPDLQQIDRLEVRGDVLLTCARV